ncbi:MAG: (Fe-S)-binding protein [Desulfobacterales bacterium]|jgi:Fe-S oxidoreductase|nr:(Fe-S)-binding protein [Desulfobacterales bacterium]MDP6682841.1 (Fe-S)-binding protein [Desulfobacterales bacterium]MDP6807820.1 (Fe-S)-binding protein [Desulfobacterales bacterium]|tara:strand:+ start:35031 stop:36164 length:1134 start_codon:yes stop_codon:yes gene_type:complete
MKQKTKLTQTQIDYCMECGICTGSCPISRELHTFSPRQMIRQSTMKQDGGLLQSPELWACLSCARCSERCPVDIDFPEFLRLHREKARKIGNFPRESHHGVLQLAASLQTHNIKQQRIGWAESVGVFKDKGDYFYFVGCLPFFDITFRYLGLSPLNIARSVLRLLNKMGIEPVISNDERCCGHDALWCGNEVTFNKLAEWNLKTIKATGAKRVLFSCPEGYFTFKEHYPKYVGELPFEVLHMTEFLARELPDAGVSFQPLSKDVVTYQDPCRLGRCSGIYEPPRRLLHLFPETQLIEMERNRENGLCCGTSAWMECSSCSKAMQVERLQEAIQTGAQTLVTACPKCQIHLMCALGTIKQDLRVTDIYTYLEERLEKE